MFSGILEKENLSEQKKHFGGKKITEQKSFLAEQKRLSHKLNKQSPKKRNVEFYRIFVPYFFGDSKNRAIKQARKFTCFEGGTEKDVRNNEIRNKIWINLSESKFPLNLEEF
jgi:hypothetical protein